MKEPWEWTEEDLLALIASGEKEGITLDYKGSDSLQKTDGRKNEISKDVSAFANSAGGVLVYGITEDGNVPAGIDGGIDPAEITKEWIDQVITSRIHRCIDGVRINQVDLRTKAPGRVAYVVYVPQSLRAPHQAWDKKFYKRSEFQSVPMEEYEIRDVARRSDAPILRLRYSFRDSQKTMRLHPAGSCTNADQVLLFAFVWNESPSPAEHFVVHLCMDERLHVIHPTRQDKFNCLPTEGMVIREHEFRAHHLVMNWSASLRPLVFEGEEFMLSGYPLIVTLKPRVGEFNLGWIIRAPRMAPQTGRAILKSDGTDATIEEVLD